MLRAFVAIDIPDPIQEQLGLLYGGIPGARWIDGDSMHLTLRFIGDVEGHVFEDIASGLELVDGPSFDLELAGVGHFPPRRQPKVLWAGVPPNEALKRLRDRVDRCCITRGVKPEGRKFHPHVTVARLNGSPSQRVARFLADNALFRTEPFEVHAFHLYTSHLRAEGARHTREYTFALGTDAL